MPIIDFKEIPQANVPSGQQDTFELFAEDFLRFLGYKVVSGPGRGADAGADLIVEETRVGIGGDTKLLWLVSCKHRAHSGASVGISAEDAILDRVRSKNCQGFVGFYSTLPSSTLSDRLQALKGELEAQVMDSAFIESHLLSSPAGLHLAERYFPSSILAWQVENPKPATVYTGIAGLKCHYCGKELLSPDVKEGIVVVWKSLPSSELHQHRKVTSVYWCCKGNCDINLKQDHDGPDLIDGWEDIPDLCIPVVYMKWIMATLNELKSGFEYDDEAFERKKQLILELYPYVARDVTSSERETIRGLMQMPTYMGGLGP